MFLNPVVCFNFPLPLKLAKQLTSVFYFSQVAYLLFCLNDPGQKRKLLSPRNNHNHLRMRRNKQESSFKVKPSNNLLKAKAFKLEQGNCCMLQFVFQITYFIPFFFTLFHATFLIVKCLITCVLHYILCMDHVLKILRIFFLILFSIK